MSFFTVGMWLNAQAAAMGTTWCWVMMNLVWALGDNELLLFSHQYARLGKYMAFLWATWTVVGIVAQLLLALGSI